MKTCGPGRPRIVSAGTTRARLWRRRSLGLWRRGLRRGKRRTSSATIYHENNAQDTYATRLGLFDSARILFDRLRGTLAARVNLKQLLPQSCLTLLQFQFLGKGKIDSDSSK